MKTETTSKKVKLECAYCKEEFQIEEYIPGKTFCPYCGLSSGLRLESQRSEIKPITTSRKKKVEHYECEFCKVRWTKKLGNTCPYCKRPTKKSVEVEI